MTSPHASDPGYRLPTEIRNQVLDFLAANPLGYGVQWACPMDVAIRAVNWLLARDLLQAHGCGWDDAAEAAFRRGIHDHGRFLLDNVEWNPDLRGNHYLCDLIGLLFCGAYLPATAETDGWLAFGLRGLADEIPRQFARDGANFEASTSYHRLSGEAVLYATALVLGLPVDRMAIAAGLERPDWAGRPGWQAAPLTVTSWRGRACPFPSEVMERLARIPEVTAALLREDGTVPQFGDNDNGRLLLDPAVSDHDGEGGDEIVLDHRHLMATAAALFGRGDWAGHAGPFVVDAAVVSGLARFELAELPPAPRPAPRPTSGFSGIAGLGVWVWRRPGWHLALRCGDNGSNGFGGHAHCDQLAFELAVDGWPVIVDAGSGVYTPLPAIRNAFRGVAAHNTLVLEGGDQNRPHPDSLFRLIDEAQAEVVQADETSFTGRHYGYGPPHTRRLVLGERGVMIEDSCAADGAKTLRLLLHPAVTVFLEPDGSAVLLREERRIVVRLPGSQWRAEAARWSPAYGRIVPTTALVVAVGAHTVWSLEYPS